MQLVKKLIEFYPFENAIVVRRKDKNDVLRIDPTRAEAEEIAQDVIATYKATQKISVEADALFGIVSLIDEEYFVYVRKSEMVAQVLGKPIYRSLEMDFVAVNSTLRKHRDKNYLHSSKDRMFQTLFLALLNNSSFYFSESYDLTNSFQRQTELGFNPQLADQAFLVNRPYLVDLKSQRAMNFLDYFPLFIHGYIGQGEMAGKPLLRLTIISRKDVGRLGSRYYSRGVDDLGNVSNSVETEQIWEEVGVAPADEGFSRRIFSFVQVRGSIPLFWTQLPTMAYTPRPRLDDRVRSEAAYLLHFGRLLRRYGACHSLNLIDRKGWQQELGQEFERLHEKALLQQPEGYGKQATFQWFDYHANCRGGNLTQLQALVAQNEDMLQRFGYFEALYGVDELTQSLRVRIRATQKGVIRTNCVDCLDRTNVVQSFFGRYTALLVLQKLGIIEAYTGLLRPLPAPGEALLRQLWTENADHLSILYSGTPALKTDVTRTGKRSYAGLYSDAKNSVTRYFINNFYDAEKQNVYDFISKNNVRNYPGYQAYNGAAFVKTSLLLLLLPFVMRLLFWLAGRRLNALVSRLAVVVGLIVVATFILENKQDVLHGHVSKP